MVNKLYQDRYGYIWIATENGLNRFDGNTFSIYKINDQKNNQFISLVTEDSKGRLLIGSLRGLEIYDRQQDQFVSVPIYREGEQITAYISAILERKNGEFWVASSQSGLVAAPSIDVDSLQVDTLVMADMMLSHVNVLYEDNNQNVWIGTETKGLFYCKSRHSKPQVAITKEGTRMYNISSICEDTSGNIFVATLDCGVYIKRTDSRYFELLPTGKYDSVLQHVKALSWNPESHSMLIGTDGEGAFHYRIGMSSPEPLDLRALSAPSNRLKIHDFLIDNNNNLWVGLYQKGVLFVPKNEKIFDYIGPRDLQHNLIGSSCVMAVYADDTNNLWVGTDNDGLYQVDKYGNSYHHVEQTVAQGIKPRTIMSIAKDSRGYLWLGTYHNGLVRFDPRTSTFTPIDLGESFTERISSITLVDDTWLWITTYGSGVSRYNIHTGRNVPIPSDGYIMNKWATCIGVEQEKIWIGTSTGLYRVSHPRSKAPLATPIMEFHGEVITTILTNNDSTVWLGTRRGLSLYDQLTKKQVVYDTQKGLSNNVVCGIQRDALGTLWVSTQQGLTHFNPITQECKRYYDGDGLQGNEFIRKAYSCDKHGVFYFGGINGVSYFNPLELHDQLEYDMRLQLTSLKVNNQERRKIYDKNAFTFSHTDHNMEWTFSTFDFARQNRTYYTYCIAELGNQWMHTNPGENKIAITNLVPGKYTLMVRAKNDHGRSPIVSYHIDITPPWYATRPAQVVWVLLILLGIAAIIRYAYSRVRMKKELLLVAHEEELKEAKLQTFVNVSHDIKTPMSLIMAPLQTLQTGDKAHSELYSMMYRNGRRIIKLIEQLMDVQTLDKGQFEVTFRPVNITQFIEQCSLDFMYEAERKSINFTFQSSDDTLSIWTDTNALEKILLNLLSNAFKFTPEGGEISVGITMEGDVLYIAVSDTGIGVQPQDVDRIFDRFYKANTSLARSPIGNGIGLHLSLALAQLLHGDLKAEQRLHHEGIRFVLNLPIGEVHLQGETVMQEPWTESEVTKGVDTTLSFSELSSVHETVSVSARTHKRQTILIVDDEEEIRDYLYRELSHQYDVLTAENGLVALKLAIKERPTLIVSDVMMSGMDGMRLCKRIKQNIVLHDTPVILLTAKVKPEDRIDGLHYGADAYIEKPFNLDILKATIENLIQRRISIENVLTREELKQQTIQTRDVETPDEQLLTRINTIINQELANSEFNVTTLAEKVGISRVHLNRKLTQLTNQTTSDYIRSIRLEQAKHMLQSGNQSIAEIAYAVGFTNISHFSKVFKQQHGISPKECHNNE